MMAPFPRAATALALLALPAAAFAQGDLAAIAARDDAGPRLNAVIVAKDRATLEGEIAAESNLPLRGRTVLVKDNSETPEWPTTAGSLALASNATHRDAPPIARLRASGGVVLGKTNLSEWANIRSTPSTSGWSAVGGLTKNPYALGRNACGSYFGKRGRRRGRALVGSNRYRDGRLDHVPRQRQWRGRLQAHRRHGQPHFRRADQP